MSADLLFVLVFFAAVGSGLIGGLLFAFSNFVMKALGRIEPAGGIAAMQAINDLIVNPLFILAFVGTALASLFGIVVALWQGAGGAATSLIAGGACYLLGVIGVTGAFNIPRNDALARLDAASTAAEAAWQTYLRSWTRWNHVRTVAALGAAVLLTHALVRIGSA